MIEFFRELLGLVRAAVVGWPETVRLCMVLLAVAAAAWPISQMI